MQALVGVMMFVVVVGVVASVVSGGEPEARRRLLRGRRWGLMSPQDAGRAPARLTAAGEPQRISSSYIRRRLRQGRHCSDGCSDERPVRMHSFEDEYEDKGEWGRVTR